VLILKERACSVGNYALLLNLNVFRMGNVSNLPIIRAAFDVPIFFFQIEAIDVSESCLYVGASDRYK